MINDLNGRLVLFAITLFIHVGTLFVYRLEGMWDVFPRTWSYPFSAIVLLMMGLSIVMLFLNKPSVRLGMLIFRVVLAVALAVPFSHNILIVAFLFAILIFEAYLYLPMGLATCNAVFIGCYNLWLSNQSFVLWKQQADVDLIEFMSAYSLFVLCGAMGYYLSREQRLRAMELKRIHELRLSNRQLAAININLQAVAAEERTKTLTTERSRIAREIHDSVAYTLTNLLSLLDVYRARLQAEAAEIPENIVQARLLVKEGLDDIRQVLRGLRPGGNEGYTGLGKISHLANIFKQATGIMVDLNYGDVPQYLGQTLEDVLYRVVQEGLTNAFRHGHATRVLVGMRLVQSGVELTVLDNGKGADDLTGGFGLVGITERIQALQGQVSISSNPGLGFTLRVWVPLEEA